MEGNSRVALSYRNVRAHIAIKSFLVAAVKEVQRDR